jgi:hypothetical protein
MGFFSWKTQDTNRSIPNVHQEMKEPFTVFMIDNKGNVWQEDAYMGYGEFGGKDFYELLAEMNGETTRDEGIDITYSGKPYLSPNLVEDIVGWDWINKPSTECEFQGFFYDEMEL